MVAVLSADIFRDRERESLCSFLPRTCGLRPIRWPCASYSTAFASSLRSRHFQTTIVRCDRIRPCVSFMRERNTSTSPVFARSRAPPWRSRATLARIPARSSTPPARASDPSKRGCGRASSCESTQYVASTYLTLAYSFVAVATSRSLFQEESPILVSNRRIVHMISTGVARSW